MNKNPFVTTAAYTPQQPPLPPGAPPPQPAQPDYSAYWQAAAAAQHNQAAQTYTAQQWPAAAAAAQAAQAATARPPADQSALYANYGYGNQQNRNWQQQQQQQHQHPHHPPQQHFQPPPPVAQPPPPPPPQPAYNPYQPQAGAYQQPYVPQGGPAPQVAAAPYQPPVAPAPFQQQQQQPFFQQQQRPPPPRQNNRVFHHGSPPQPPPAKRQRFDGPNQNRGTVPPPPQFQPPPPPPPMQQQQGMFGQGPQGPGNQSFGRGGGPMGGSRGGFNPGRGGNNQGGRGRGGQTGMIRGGARGRGGGYNMGGRGGGGGQGGGSFRGHAPNRGFGNRDNRRGGSFNGGGSFHQQGHQQGYQQQPHHHQQQQQHHHQHHQNSYSNNGSFRGRNQGFTHSTRGARHDAHATHGRDNASVTSTGFSSGKKEENRRTLTDFKVVGLEISELSWSWSVAKSDAADAPVKTEDVPISISSTAGAGAQSTGDSPVKTEPVAATPDAPATGAASGSGDVSGPSQASAIKSEPTAILPPPPSRVRIYFHTPVTADDSHLISSNAPYAQPSTSRKGKRKKLEDDDGDLEDGRGPPPPAPHSSEMGHEHDVASVDGTETAFGRDSVAPSVEETASEGDWLMAAIGGEEGEGEGQGHENGDEYHDPDADAEGEYDNSGYDDVQGEGHDEYHMGGDEGAHDSGEQQHDDHAPSAEQGGMSVDSQAAPGPDNAVPSGPNASSEAGDPSGNAVNGSAPAPSSASPGIPASADSASMSSAIGPTNTSPNGDAQAGVAPLQATNSLISTVPDTDAQGQNLEREATAPGSPSMDQTQPTDDAPYQGEESSFSNAGPYAPDPSSSQASKAGRVASANRLSAAYAGGTRRMVIDAEIVDSLKVFRAEARIEACINVERDDAGGYKGIMMEAYSESVASYLPLEMSEDVEADPTVPPFSKAALPTKVTLIVHLDRQRPLSEPRWVKSGDVHEWLKSMFGRMFWVAGDAAEGWEKKIQVVDPDPAPTIWTVLETWAQNSNIGQQTERQRFLRTHMTETDNILEILLRLVRGERSGTGFQQATPAVASPNLVGPLLTALSPGAAHGAQQTHVSLAVLAVFRLAVEYAKRVSPENGKHEVEERVGEIIRSLPSHLLYKSLDGIFKEWKADKKGGKA